MAAVEVLIIDDDGKQAERLASLLNRQGDGLRARAHTPEDSVEKTASLVEAQLPDDKPRLLLLDYRLEDHPPEQGAQVTFRGGTIAGYLRDKDPELPIWLLTSEEKLHAFVER